MAAVAPSAEHAADLVQKLSLDSQTKTLEATEQAKQDGPVLSAGTPNGMAEPYNPTAGYLTKGYLPPAYYFGGYDAQGNPWNDYSIYLNTDGPIASNVYGDNCSIMYSQGYGYSPYGYTPPTSPAPSMQPEGQLYGMQHYQYHGPYYQSTAPAHGSTILNKVGSNQGKFQSSVAGDQISLSFDVSKSDNGNILNSDVGSKNNGLKPLVSSPQDALNCTHDKQVLPPCLPLPGYPDLRGSSNGIQSQIPLTDGPTVPSGQSIRPSRAGISSMVAYGEDFSSWSNKNLHPPQFMNMQNTRPLPGLGLASGYMNEVFSGNRMYSRFENSLRTGTGFGTGGGYNYRTSGRGWNIDGKFKSGGFGNYAVSFGKENCNAFNELNKGPRAKGGDNKIDKDMGTVTLLLNGQSLPASNDDEVAPQVPNKEEFSGEGFPDSCDNAKFFVIKSYSEDDIHKSIKYGVWASTPNGNKKLNAAYLEAKEMQDSCHIFLLFSVNASGQFVGLAEMIGPVDFDKTLEYWQQDKWNGCFPVKWRIIKDVPNGLLKHIILKNNENKPVTNSRDTQEVKLEQGIQIVKIFKSHASKTCILDDFGFYDSRQTTMQESKSKERQFRKQASVKASDLQVSDNNILTKSLDVASVKLSVVEDHDGNEADTDRDAKVSGENDLVTATDDGA